MMVEYFARHRDIASIDLSIPDFWPELLVEFEESSQPNEPSHDVAVSAVVELEESTQPNMPSHDIIVSAHTMTLPAEEVSVQKSGEDVSPNYDLLAVHQNTAAVEKSYVPFALIFNDSCDILISLESDEETHNGASGEPCNASISDRTIGCNKDHAEMLIPSITVIDAEEDHSAAATVIVPTYPPLLPIDDEDDQSGDELCGVVVEGIDIALGSSEESTSTCVMM